MSHRLCFTSPCGKLDWNFADFAATINNTSSDALFFLDTNFFTKPMDAQVWDALRNRQIIITPMVLEELKDWKATPFHNPSIRDVVVQAERLHAMGLPPPPELLALLLQSLGAPYFRMTELLMLGERYKAHGYVYYFNLLALRKQAGPMIAATLERTLGRQSTSDEFAKITQSNFGDRGLRLAMKGAKRQPPPTCSPTSSSL